MLAGAPAGADIVLLDQRVGPCGLAAEEVGLALNWKVGRTGAVPTDAAFAALSAVGGLRCRLPLSPAHLRAARVGGDLSVRWIRRGRLDADAWEPADIPLGEAEERYRVEVAAPGGPVARMQIVGEPAWLYPEAAIAADFPVPPGEVEVTVRQFSLAAGWGVPAMLRFAL